MRSGRVSGHRYPGSPTPQRQRNQQRTSTPSKYTSTTRIRSRGQGRSKTAISVSAWWIVSSSCSKTARTLGVSSGMKGVSEENPLSQENKLTHQAPDTPSMRCRLMHIAAENSKYRKSALGNMTENCISAKKWNKGLVRM